MKSATDTQRLSIGNYITTEDRQRLDKQMLAMDALNTLSRQFSDRPDFPSLIENIVLTLAGQFSVANGFALLSSPESDTTQHYFAIGKFRGNSLLEELILTDEHSQYFLENSQPQFVENLDHNDTVSNLGFVLSECDVRLIIPMIHDNRLLGFFGLGDKVNRKPFEPTELDMLATFVSTITPLITNSFLFMEISNLSVWYLKILNSVQQGVFVFDNANLLQKANLTGFNMLRMFRPNLRQIEALYHVPLQLVFPESIFPGWGKRFTRDVTDIGDTAIEKMKGKIDDLERVFNVRVNHLADGNGNPSGLIITLDDVTEQENREQRLFDLEKLADKGMMASSISHELNNFLGLILGGVELTQIAVGKNDSAKVTRTLEKLKGTVAKMERFTAGLMNYARLDTSKSMTNLNTVVRDVLSFVKVQKRFRDIQVETDLVKGIPRVEMDGDQIAQLLINMLNNAADAIREADRDQGIVKVRTRLEDSHMILSVGDNGAGIKTEVKDKLFSNSLTTKADGHGYGLVTCAKIIENHAGQVEIDTEPGRGTTFIMRFLIADKAQ